MTSQVVQFAGLSNRDRKKVTPLPKLARAIASSCTSGAVTGEMKPSPCRWRR
jgi:hypothetical protein